MKTAGQHIIFAFMAVVSLFASCSRDDAEVIPRNTLAEIYAEMFVTDQWISSNPSVRQIADTSLVYEPILEKYGYNSEDYRKTIDVYMDDPERFARIFKATAGILEGKIGELKKQQAILDAIAKLPKIKSDFKVEDYVPYWGDEPYVHYFDSLDVVLDSATRMYQLVSVERGDTLYDRIRMVKPEADTLATDSLKVDSLKKEPVKVETLEKRPKPVKFKNQPLKKDSFKKKGDKR